MNKSNSFKLGCGIVVSLTLGLSGCYMDSPFSGRADNAPEQMTKQSSNTTQAAVTTSKTEQKQAAKEPVQPTTPGPKRTAAPQIPVIQ